MVSFFVESRVRHTPPTGLKLVTTDGKKTEIAKFHQARYFPKRQKAQLVVQPAGIAMVDHIVLTFVFAEQRRRERESAK